MKLSELIEKLDLIPVDHYDRHTVVIEITKPFATVGGTPTIPVKAVMCGFDWDNGKFIIVPAEPLMKADNDFAKKMKNLQTRLGQADYENHRLKSEIKRLKQQIGDNNA